MSNSTIKIGSNSAGRLYAGSGTTGKMCVGSNVSFIQVSASTQPQKESGFTISDVGQILTQFSVGDYVVIKNWLDKALEYPRYYLAVDPSTSGFSSLSSTTRTLDENTIIDNAVFILEDAGSGHLLLKNLGTGLYLGYNGLNSETQAPFVSSGNAEVMEFLNYTYDSSFGNNAFYIASVPHEVGINNLYANYENYNWWNENLNETSDDGNAMFCVKLINR